MFNIFKTSKPMSVLEDDITIAGHLDKELNILNKYNTKDQKVISDTTQLLLDESRFKCDCSSLAFELIPPIKFLTRLQNNYKNESDYKDIDADTLFKQHFNKLISLEIETKIVTLLKSRNSFLEAPSILALTDEYHKLLIEILHALIIFKNDTNINISSIDLTNIYNLVQTLIMETQCITFSRKEWKLR